MGILVRFRSIFVLMAFTSLFSGCMNIATLGIGKVVRPEESKHYEPRGALVVLSIDREKYSSATTFMLMFSDTSSFSMYIPNDVNYILLDVPFGCTGIGRTGVVFETQVPSEWFDPVCKFKLESNKINYLGRFVLEQDNTQASWDTMYITNTLAHDKLEILDLFPSLSNMEFINVSVTNGRFKTE